jgi:hypothetical protein
MSALRRIGKVVGGYKVIAVEQKLREKNGGNR